MKRRVEMTQMRRVRMEMRMRVRGRGRGRGRVRVRVRMRVGIGMRTWMRKRKPPLPLLMVRYLFLWPLILILIFWILDMDLSNLQPPEIQAPANGSSRSTGGILRGRAVGSAPNIGDLFDDMQQEVRPLPRGCINIMIVQQPPGDVVVENPVAHLKVLSPCYETFAPLMKKVAKSYSPVRSKYLIILIQEFIKILCRS
jgi:hypothetical protein